MGSQKALVRAREEEVGKRRVGAPAAAAVEVPASVRALAAQELPGGLRIGTLGVKAFAYGTALCLCGASAAMVATAWALGVSDLQQFTARMQELMPGVRSSMERGLAPVLGGVSDSGRAVARATDASVGSAVRTLVPRVQGRGLEQEMEGLNSKERKAVREWLEWVGEKPAGSAEQAGKE